MLHLKRVALVLQRSRKKPLELFDHQVGFHPVAAGGEILQLPETIAAGQHLPDIRILEQNEDEKLRSTCGICVGN